MFRLLNPTQLYQLFQELNNYKSETLKEQYIIERLQVRAGILN